MSTYSSSRPLTVALDGMGGDFGPDAVVPGAAMIHAADPAIRFLLYGDENRLQPLLMRHPGLKSVTQVFHTDKQVRSDEKPSNALRASKDTSMRLAIEAVETKRADAVVSSGNTGALMALAKLVLKPLPGIHRPAIASVFPTVKNDTIMLDLGANVLVDAETLIQFAVLGAVFSKIHNKTAIPTVGLLNVGSEETKGPDHVRTAAAMLSKIDFPGRFYGFVEGDDITKGIVDVIVTDGYAGNIALKTAEGVTKLTAHFFKESIRSDPFSVIGMFLSYFALKRFKNKLDPRRYNGGVFLGLNGLCVKSHGGADALSFSTAVQLAIDLARQGYITRVGEEINHLATQDSFLAQGAFQG